MNILDENGNFLDKMKPVAKNIDERHKIFLKPNKCVVDKVNYLSDKRLFSMYFNGKIDTTFQNPFINACYKGCFCWIAVCRYG